MQNAWVVIAFYADGSGQPVPLLCCDREETAIIWQETIQKASPLMNISVNRCDIVITTPEQ